MKHIRPALSVLLLATSFGCGSDDQDFSFNLHWCGDEPAGLRLELYRGDNAGDIPDRRVPWSGGSQSVRVIGDPPADLRLQFGWGVAADDSVSYGGNGEVIFPGEDILCNASGCSPGTCTSDGGVEDAPPLSDAGEGEFPSCSFGDEIFREDFENDDLLEGTTTEESNARFAANESSQRGPSARIDILSFGGFAWWRLDAPSVAQAPVDTAYFRFYLEIEQLGDSPQPRGFAPVAFGADSKIRAHLPIDITPESIPVLKVAGTPRELDRWICVQIAVVTENFETSARGRIASYDNEAMRYTANPHSFDLESTDADLDVIAANGVDFIQIGVALPGANADHTGLRVGLDTFAGSLTCMPSCDP